MEKCGFYVIPLILEDYAGLKISNDTSLQKFNVYIDFLVVKYLKLAE